MGLHKWKEIFFGFPLGFKGHVEGKSCQRCGLLKRKLNSGYRHKQADINQHYIFTNVSLSQMTNKEKQFYLRNLNNIDKGE